MTSSLFRDFADFWVLLCPSSELQGDRPVSYIVAGERIVLFRERSGTARALIDRCPHRGVALSLGKVTDGEIACPFHGWRFDGHGRCRHVPWNPDAKLESLSARPLPLREAAGLLWLYTGDQANREPTVPEVLMRDDIHVTAQHFHWSVHWTRVMENMLDTPHLPFVHARTIGKKMRGRTDRRMDMAWLETPYGAEITAHRDGEAPQASLRYHFPNMMELVIDPPGRIMRLLAVCTPESAGHTRLTICTVRNFARWKWLDPLFRRANAKIAAEDRVILESSQPGEVPMARDERSVATDAPTLAFRKIWFSRIKGS